VCDSYELRVTGRDGLARRDEEGVCVGAPSAMPGCGYVSPCAHAGVGYHILGNGLRLVSLGVTCPWEGE
jgi:hypothetical protein